MKSSKRSECIKKSPHWVLIIFYYIFLEELGGRGQTGSGRRLGLSDHIVCPRLSIWDFFAAKVGLGGCEIGVGGYLASVAAVMALRPFLPPFFGGWFFRSASRSALASRHSLASLAPSPSAALTCAAVSVEGTSSALGG